MSHKRTFSDSNNEHSAEEEEESRERHERNRENNVYAQAQNHNHQDNEIQRFIVADRIHSTNLKPGELTQQSDNKRNETSVYAAQHDLPQNNKDDEDLRSRFDTKARPKLLKQIDKTFYDTIWYEVDGQRLPHLKRHEHLVFLTDDQKQREQQFPQFAMAWEDVYENDKETAKMKATSRRYCDDDDMEDVAFRKKIVPIPKKVRDNYNPLTKLFFKDAIERFGLNGDIPDFSGCLNRDDTPKTSSLNMIGCITYRKDNEAYGTNEKGQAEYTVDHSDGSKRHFNPTFWEHTIHDRDGQHGTSELGFYVPTYLLRNYQMAQHFAALDVFQDINTVEPKHSLCFNDPSCALLTLTGSAARNLKQIMTCHAVTTAKQEGFEPILLFQNLCFQSNPKNQHRYEFQSITHGCYRTNIGLLGFYQGGENGCVVIKCLFDGCVIRFKNN